MPATTAGGAVVRGGGGAGGVCAGARCATASSASTSEIDERVTNAIGPPGGQQRSVSHYDEANPTVRRPWWFRIFVHLRAGAASLRRDFTRRRGGARRRGGLLSGSRCVQRRTSLSIHDVKVFDGPVERSLRRAPRLR